MTTTSTIYAPRYGTPARATPAAAVVRVLARLVQAIATEYRIRRDMRRLTAMSEHMLKDIGLSRTQIAHAVRFGRI